MSPRSIAPRNESPRGSSRRGLPWGKLAFIAFLGVLALGWFAPAIVVNSRLRDSLLKSMLQDFPGTVAIQSASAGWLSSVELKGASVFDDKGEELLSVASIKTKKNLFSLLLDPWELGVIRIEQPNLKLVIRPDGSNLEDLLRPWLTAAETSSAVGCGIEIVDGSMEVFPPDRGASWRFDQLNATSNVPRNRAAPLSAQLKSLITTAAAPAGELALDVHWKRATGVTSVEGAVATDPATSGPDGATIQCNGLPLEIVTVVLRRFGLDVQLAGLLTTDAELAFSSQSQTAKVKKLAVQNLFIASPILLGPDRLQFATVTGSGEISRGAAEWQFRKVAVNSDAAAFEASGVGPAGNAASLAGELASAFRRGHWEIRGTADVAKLAEMIPTTLRLRDGTHVSSGQLTTVLTSQATPAGNAWNVDVQASQLAAIHAGTSFAWNKPILVKAAVTESAGGFRIDQLTCESSFLQLAGKGTFEQGQFTVRGDLSQFTSEIGRFVDLGSLRAAGNFDGQIDWQSSAGGQTVSLGGKGSATNFELTYAADRPWREPQLGITFQAAGQVDSGKVTKIDRGTLRIIAAGDQLDAELLQPVVGISAATSWPCHVHVRGDLSQWLARLQMFVSLDPWLLDADAIDWEGDVQASTARLQYVNAKGTATNFQFIGSGMTIREPKLQFESTGAFDIPRSEFTSPTTIVSGSSIALNAQNARLLYNAGQVALDGEVRFRANLERLAEWIRDTSQPESYRVQGEATGAVQLKYVQGATQADATATIEKFSYAKPVRSTGLTITAVNPSSGWQELWVEPQLQLALKGSLDAGGQLATIEKLEAAGDSLSLGAAGSVRHPFARCELDLAGQYAYDLGRLSQRLRGALGPGVQMAGTGQRPFSLKGPLFAATASQPKIRTASTKVEPTALAGLHEMLAEASIGWQKLSVHGFEIGEGELVTKLEQGQLSMSPISLPVSEGKILISPRVDVSRTPYVATVEPGTVVDHVRISPEMCRSWLKYLAPLMANATSAEGHFSVLVDDAKFPVSDPTGGNIQGKFIVHAAQIGPGPLSQEILALVQTIRAIIDKQPLEALGAPQPSASQWLDVPEQQLNFQLADHRVYHRDMQVMVKDVAVRTSGWVGLDQQIALVAEIPIREDWVAKDRYLASLKGQSIRLPINGSLSRPQVDRTAIRELTRQTVVNAGTNLLQQEVSRGLNRLFQPKPPAIPAPATPVPQAPPR